MMVYMVGPSTLTGQWWKTIDAFNARAERILSSAIARREDLATVGTQFQLMASVTKGHHNWRVAHQTPPEADVESASARIRPLFLKNGPVFHGKVTTAIGGLAQRYSSEQDALIKSLKKAWKDFDKGGRWSMGVSKDPSTLGGEMRTDRQIARDFLYGDLVHADEAARERLIGIPTEDKLSAAVVWVADATRLTEATRRLIIDLTNAGGLTKRPS